MKMMLTKCFLFLLLGIKIHGQTVEQRAYIASNYNTNLLSEMAVNFSNNYNYYYNMGIQILLDNDNPLNGFGEEGAYFSLKGYDPETGQVLYYQSQNNTTTKSAIQTANVSNLHNGSVLGIPITGNEMIMGIWDANYPLVDHQNLGASRIVLKDGVNQQSNQNSKNHPTHIGGTMIGNGIYNSSAKGLAYSGNLWANDWDNDFAEMTNQALEGLLVSNHSYTVNNVAYVNLPGVFGRYNANSKSADLICYNADMYMPVYVAGNNRNGVYVGGQLVALNPSKNGYDLMINERVAKNPVVVAAVEGITSYQSIGYTQNNVIMSTFSQWGPTDDFRIKPDISAKGVNVYSSSAQTTSQYSVLSGTSMAAPSVTAVFALWQQYANVLWGTSNQPRFLKAASLKALMAHSASEAGNAEGPDPKFGWGVINAEAGALILKKVNENSAYFKELQMVNYQTYSVKFYCDGTEPIVATLAWTDMPYEPVAVSESTTPVLVNDLDLRIKRLDTNEIIKPWALNKSWTNIYALRADNNVDPIEKVTYHLDNNKAPAGEYEVLITHKNELVGGKQNFSLFISGGTSTFNQTVGNEKFEIDEYKIFPNPTEDYVFVNNNNIKRIEVYDLVGKRLNINQIPDGNFLKLDLKTLQSGTYLLKIESEKSFQTKKIIKK